MELVVAEDQDWDSELGWAWDSQRREAEEDSELYWTPKQDS